MKDQCFLFCLSVTWLVCASTVAASLEKNSQESIRRVDNKSIAAAALRPAEAVEGTQEKEPTPEPQLSPDQTLVAIALLRSKHLLLPIMNADVSTLKGSYNQLRGGEPHHAV